MFIDGNIVKGGVFGAAVGDALGFPFEFKRRHQVNAISAGGPSSYHYLGGCSKGEVSDDTYMSIAVIEGIKANETNLEVTKKRFQDWLHSDRFWPSVPGITTYLALNDECAVPSEGNGACMKSHISALFIDNTLEAINHAINVAKVTHLSEEPGHNEAAVALVVLATKYAITRPSNPTLTEFIEFSRPWVAMMENDVQDYFEKNLDQLSSINLEETNEVSGWSVDTANYAIRVWLSSPDDFVKAVQTAVLLGGDTDTVASVVGGIAGSYLGFDAIPSHLIEPLNVREELFSLL